MMPNQQSLEKNGSVLQMIHTLENCLKNVETSPRLGMAAKALAQLESHSDTVTAETVDWKDKYEQMEQLYNERLEKIDDLAEENGQLLVKCHLLEVDERRLNDMLLEKIDDLADDNEKLEALFESSPVQDASTTLTNSSSYSGDVYRQLDQFEHSLDMELEDFQQLGLLESLSVIAMASSDENEKNTSANISEDGETNDSESGDTSSSCREVLVGDKPFEIEISIVTPLQNKTLETIKDTPRASNTSGPRQLFHRMFQTQTQPVYDAPPAMTISTSLESLVSDYSISTRSSSDLLSLIPTKKTMKMSLQPNAEWAIIEQKSA